jgi:hypothetical protein
MGNVVELDSVRSVDAESREAKLANNKENIEKYNFVIF